MLTILIVTAVVKVGSGSFLCLWHTYIWLWTWRYSASYQERNRVLELCMWADSFHQICNNDSSLGSNSLSFGFEGFPSRHSRTKPSLPTNIVCDYVKKRRHSSKGDPAMQRARPGNWFYSVGSPNRWKEHPKLTCLLSRNLFTFRLDL